MPPSGTPSLPTDTSDSPAPVTHLPDPKAIIRGVLEASLHKFKIPEAIDSSQLIDAAIPSDEIIAQLDIASPDGKKQIDIIVKGLEQTILETLNGVPVESPPDLPFWSPGFEPEPFDPNELCDEGMIDGLIDGFEEAGIEIPEELVEPIGDIVTDVVKDNVSEEVRDAITDS